MMTTGKSISDITEFFYNRAVFMTGATGFVGKALLEKILRACPGVKRIYILTRSKRGDDMHTRLAKLFSSTLFNNLSNINPDIFSKVTPIEGDISLPELGISNHDRKTLSEEVSVVIHSAATVKFNENLKISLELNVNGTMRIIELCKDMKNLASYVHISTAYAHCDRATIDEGIYPLATDPIKLVERLNGMSESEIESQTEELIGSRPNTYTYTKALTECLLSQYGHQLPICIVRPSIVTASWKEPFPGWVDGLNGATGTIAAIGVGALRSLLCHGDKVADLIPVDILVNLILTAAWETGRPSSNQSIPIYNCCSGDQNPVLWGQMQAYVQEAWTRHPYSGAIRAAQITFRSSWIWSRMADLILHLLPACLLDIKALVLGRERKALKGSLRLAKAMESAEFFRTQDWDFVTRNVTSLRQKLSAEDQALYNFEIKDVNWAEYVENYCLGIRANILKEKGPKSPTG